MDKRRHPMTRIRQLFVLLMIIGPLHMIEQLLTSLEEFHMLRRQLAGYYALFDPAAADSATVILITIVWTICSLLFYAVLREGIPRLLMMGLMGVFGVSELHHVLEAVAKGGYDAGVITCVPYAYVGALLVGAVWRELTLVRRSIAVSPVLTT